jgi:hypothetical protein
MKIKGKVLSAKQEERELVSKTTGLQVKHNIFHILVLSNQDNETEVLNVEAWNPKGFDLPDVGKDWVSPPVKSIQFEGSVGTVRI